MNVTELPFTLEAYQKEALRTTGTFNNKHLAVAYWTLGICGEADELEEAYVTQPDITKEAGDLLWYVVVLASELDIPLDMQKVPETVESSPTLRACQLAETIKKHIGHGRELDKDAVGSQLHDLLGIIFEVSRDFNKTPAHIMRANIEKLRARYPEGFSYKASEERKDLERE